MQCSKIFILNYFYFLIFLGNRFQRRVSAPPSFDNQRASATKIKRSLFAISDDEEEPQHHFVSEDHRKKVDEVEAEPQPSTSSGKRSSADLAPPKMKNYGLADLSDSESDGGDNALFLSINDSLNKSEVYGLSRPTTPSSSRASSQIRSSTPARSVTSPRSSTPAKSTPTSPNLSRNSSFVSVLMSSPGGSSLHDEDGSGDDLDPEPNNDEFVPEPNNHEFVPEPNNQQFVPETDFVPETNNEVVVATTSLLLRRSPRKTKGQRPLYLRDYV